MHLECKMQPVSSCLTPLAPQGDMDSRASGDDGARARSEVPYPSSFLICWLR